MSGPDSQNTLGLCLAVWDLGLHIYLLDIFLFDHALSSHQTVRVLDMLKSPNLVEIYDLEAAR